MHGLLFVVSLHLGTGQPRGDSWLGTDKAQHFFMSAFVESLSFSALRTVRVPRGAALVGATAAASAVGVGKELYDARHGGDPSWKDLTWDGAGIAAGALLMGRTR